MESRSLKVVDEHSIDRDAYIICGVEIEGSEYVIYQIERDQENDNLFVSKIIQNNDKTFNMINIEDQMEKSEISDIIKELITKAVMSNEETIANDSLLLKNGKNVKIIDVLFNKEQSINVQKTYVTTVKKKVTETAEKYYKVQPTEKTGNSEIFFESTPEPVEEVKVENTEETEQTLEPVVEVETPVTEAVPEALEEVVEETKEVMPVVDEPVTLVDTTVNVEKEENPLENIVISSVELPKEETAVETPISNGVVNEEKVVENNTIGENSVPVMADTIPVIESKPEEIKPTINENLVDNSEKVEDILPVTSSELTEKPKEDILPEPVSAIEQPVMQSTEQSPVSSNEIPTTQSDDVLTFDGSKESNLKPIFADAGDAKPVMVTPVETIREFGQDGQINNQDVEELPKASQKTLGFANNKFFMVIAIAFFLASCVFLGYEVFKYIQMVK